MKKTSKALSFILTLCMIASLFAGLGISGTASAANGLMGTVLTIDSAEAAHGTGWDWDGSTLTLSGVSLTKLGIGLNTPVTIVLEGANKVVSGSGDAISAPGDLSIQGSGTLEVQGTNNSINVSGTLTISSGYIEVKSATANKNAISCINMTVNGGYLDVSTTAVGSAILCRSSTKQYSQSGGYVKASNVGSGSYPCLSANTVTVSGGYLEASATGTDCVCIFALGGISNTGGVIKATSESYDGIATSTNANFAGGVTIVKTTSGESAISGNIINGSDGETLFDNTGASVAQTGTELTTSKIESDLKSVVIAKSVAAPAAVDSKLTLDGHYLYSADAVVLNAYTLGGNVVVDGGSYIGSASPTYDALSALTKQVDVNATLVCTATDKNAMRAATLNVSADATLVGISGKSSDGVKGTTLNLTGGNCIGISKTTGTGVSSSLNISGGYVCGVAEGAGKGIGASNMTVSGGYVTAKSSATATSPPMALYMASVAPVFNDDNGGGYVTAVGVGGAYGIGALNGATANAMTNVAVTGTTDLDTAWSAVELAVIGIQDTRWTYKVGGTTAVAVFIKYAPPVRTFVLPDGTTASDKPADPEWAGTTYTFAGWFEKDENGDYTGDALDGDGVLGKTYYTKWTSGGKTVRTTPLDCSTIAVNTDKLATEGWAWYATESNPYAANTLVLDGATIDCSGVTNNDKAIITPDSGDIIVKVVGNNLVKAGSNNGTHSQAIYPDNKLTILGNGSLDVMSAPLTANGSYSYGIAAGPSSSLVIGSATDSPNVTIKGSAGANSYGIACSTTVLGGSLIVSGDNAAFSTGSTLTTTGTVKAGENADSATAPAVSSPYTLTDKYVNVSFVKYLSFDNRGGSGTEQVEIKADMTLPASNPTWTSGDNTYSFGGWYTGIDGTGDEVTSDYAKELEASTEVYAKWTNGGKTVRTTPLDLSLETDNIDKLAAEGWTWTPKTSPAYNDRNPISADNNSGTLVLSDATIDCSNVTDCYYAINLPVGAIIQLADGTTNTVKSGVGSLNSGRETYTASIGIMAMGNIQISGNGTLNAYAEDVTDTANKGAWSFALYFTNIGTAGVDSPVVNAYGGDATGTGERINMSLGFLGAVVNSGKVYSSCGTASGGTDNYGCAFGEGGIVANNSTVKGHADGGKGIADLTAARIDGGAVKMGATEGDTVAGTAYITFGPIFDARNGETVEDYATYAASTTWVSGDNTYTFGGWYDGIDGTGNELDGTPTDGTTYYAKWTSGGKTVRTQPLDFTAYNESTNPTGFDADHTHGAKVFQGMYMNSDEGWTWYPDGTEPILTLDGAVIDCSNVTDCCYAVRLPAGAKIDLVSSTESTVKGGEGADTTSAGTEFSSAAFYIEGDAGIGIIGNGTLNAYAKDVSGEYDGVMSAAILTKESMTVGTANSRPTVNATSGTASNTKTDGVYMAVSTGAMAVTLVNGSVTAKSDTATAASGADYSGSYGVFTANMTGGSLRATGKTAAVRQLSATGAVATGSADYDADTLTTAYCRESNVLMTESGEDPADIAKTAYITIPPSISVSAQSGTLTYGTAVTGSVQFTVTANSFNTPAYSGEIEWVTTEHDGITLALVGNQVKVTTTAAANAGSYEFKVKSGTVYSAAVTLSIGKATYSGTASKTVNIMINKADMQSGTLAAADFFETTAPADAKITNTATNSVTNSILSYSMTINRPEGTLSYDSSRNLTTAGKTDTYNVTISSTNYEDITATLSFTTIAKTPVTVSGVAVAGKTYDGAAAVKTGTPKAVLTSDSTTDKTSDIDSWTYLYESTDTGSYSSADAPTDAGAYKLTVTADDADFDGKQVIAFTISPKAITVKPNAKSITKGATMPTFDLDVSGVIAADRAEEAFTTLLSGCTFKAQVSDSDPTAITSTATAGSYIVRWTNMSTVKAGTSGWSDYANYTVTWEDTAAFTITTPAPVAPAVSDDGAVIVDGKTEKIGTVKTDGDNKTVEVDSEKLSEKLAAADKGSSVIVTVPETKASANAELVVKSLEDMAKKEMVLEVKVGGVSYELETTAIDTKAITAQLGANDTAAIPVKVSITPLAQGSVAVTDATAVANPVKFEITASYGGKSVTVDTFGSYVSRFIEITEAQAKTITTAIVKEADGSQRHVPTEVYTQGGKWFAKINSRTNSTYVLIHSEQSFADASGKWFEAVVSEMASRKVINGRDATTFDGDGNITRAEFAAIAVRALGLPADGDCTFTDVAKSAWYYGAVGTAAQYGLISGRTSETFDPEAPITREEAMQLIYNAAKVAEYTGKTGELTGFKDAESVASWAQAAAQFNVGSGLIVGSDGKLNPTANITRAETATVVLRLLQNAGLIDIRTKA